MQKFNVKVVFDNKMTKIFENDKLIHRGFDEKSRAFAANVIDSLYDNAQKWSEVKWEKQGHKHICYLTG